MVRKRSGCRQGQRASIARQGDGTGFISTENRDVPAVQALQDRFAGVTVRIIPAAAYNGDGRINAVEEGFPGGGGRTVVADT